MPSWRIRSTSVVANVSGSGQARFQWRDLGLDVEADLLIAGFLDQRKQVHETGNARPIDRLLLEKLFRVIRAGLDAPHVVLLQLREREGMDCGPRTLEPPAGIISRDVRVQRRVVGNHDDAVLGDVRVELQRGHAEGQGGREGREGVLRRESTRPSMTL